MLNSNSTNKFHITEYTHSLVRNQAVGNILFIDATAGNGFDTLFLCKLCAAEGKVLSFDIQQQALDNTLKLLKQESQEDKAKLILDSHANMDSYAKEESADVIMFNFGYLPGSEHSLATKADTSVIAVEKALKILKYGGVMTLCIYSGGDTGFEEKDALLDFVRKLDPNKYIVIVHQFFNRPNNSPIPVLIKKYDRNQTYKNREIYESTKAGNNP